MFDIYGFYRKLALIESQLSDNETKEVLSNAVKSRGFISSMFSKKITIDDVMQAWEDDDCPTDIDDLAVFLRNIGFSKNVLTKVLDKMGIDVDEGSDERVTRLAKAIANSKIKHEVLDYLRSYRKINEAADPSHTITNAQIKALFIRVLKQASDTGAVDTDESLIKRWMQQFMSETDETMKITLASEISQFMVDRQDRKSIQNIKPIVINMIRRSDLQPSVKMDLIDSINNNQVMTSTSTDPADNEAIATVRGWVDRFKKMASPVQQYPMAAGIVNYLAGLSDSPDMGYLRRFVIDAIQQSGMSDSRKSSAIKDIKNRRHYTKATKPAKKKNKTTNPLRSQYGSTKSVKRESVELDRDQLLYIFESAIMSKTHGRYKKWKDPKS